MAKITITAQVRPGGLAVAVSKSHAVFEAIDDVLPLPRVLEAFHATPKAAQALNSPIQADKHFPALVHALSVFLEEHGWSSKIINLKHYFRSPGAGAGSAVKKQYEAGDTCDIEHAVVKVHGIVIDPCKMRMGINYDVPWNYPAPILKEFWKIQTPFVFKPSAGERKELLEGFPKNKYMEASEND